jgi:hypothetical protein
LLFVGAIIGGAVGLWQFNRNRKDDKLNNELSGAPDFFFTAPNKCKRFSIGFCDYDGDFMPKIATSCDGQCSAYWFNMVNCGKFAARNVKIVVITESEKNNILDIDRTRWKNIDFWGGMPIASSEQKGDLIPVCTNLNEIDIKSADKSIYVLIEFQSDYSKIVYKRIYKWCITDSTDNHSDDTMHQANNSYTKKDFITGLKNDFVKKSDANKPDTSEHKKLKITVIDSIGKEFHDLRLNRPVFMHDVKTLCSSSSNKTRVMKKLKTRLLKTTSKKLSMNEWLFDY